MKNFKKLQPIPLRTECEPHYESEIWQPNWRCFCCHDTGFVVERLAAYVIKGYTSGRHKIALCRASLCQVEIGESLDFTGSLDKRLTTEICDYLDSIERDNWQETVKYQHQLRKKALGLVDNLGEQKSIRLRRRTSEEESWVKRKHLEVINEYC